MEAVRAYHAELVARLHSVLGDDLVGVYAGGSYALGDYRAPASDLDVAAVVLNRLTPGTKDALIDAVRHESLPCPARGLELVVYSCAAAAAASAAADFELNLNTGERMDFRAETEPGDEWHWFAIDRAILRERGLPLFGPAAPEVFGEIPRRELLAALAESVRWHGAVEPAGENARLNALRALRYARTGEWTSKTAASAWAREQGVTPEDAAGELARSGTS